MRIADLVGTVVGLIFFSSAVFAQKGPTTIGLSGVLYSPSGALVTQANVNFKFEVWDRDSLCVLYSEEHHGVDLGTAKGRFSLILGRGVLPKNYLEDSSVLSTRVFENVGGVAPFAGCSTGLIFSDGDERLVRIYYDLGEGFMAMTPDVPVTAAAYSMVAESLSGKRVSEFVQVNSTPGNALTQEHVENIFTDEHYARLSELVKKNIPFSVDGNRLTNLAPPLVGSDGTNKNYVDGYVGGKLVDMTGVGAGQGDGYTLIWDSLAGKWVVGARGAQDNTKLPLSGGTMSGAITMGGYDLNTVGNVKLGAGKILKLGTFSDATKPTNLLPADQGTSWYNSDLNSIQVWDGIRARTYPVLDANGKLDASWMPTILPSIDGASLTNVSANRILGMPIASVTPSNGAILKWNGSAWVASQEVGLMGLYGDVSASGNGIVEAKLNDNTVSNSKLIDEAVTSSKINLKYFSNRILITDEVGGSTIKYAKCENEGEVLKWTVALGWQCSNVTSLAPVISVAGKTGAVSLNINDVDGWGSATLYDVGISAGNVVQLDSLSRLPTLDGGLLTNVSARHLLGRSLALVSPMEGQVLGWTGTEWAPTNSTSSVVVEPGSAVNPTFSFDGDPGTGWFSPALGVLAASTGSAERIRINGDGKVGIGTTQPSALLDVNGSVRVGVDVSGCTNSNKGAIRMNGADLEYCNGSSWSKVINGATGGGTTSTTGIDNNFAGITEAGSITGVGSQITGVGSLTVSAGGVAQDLTLTSSTTGSVDIGSGNGISLSVLDGGVNAVNYVTIKGASAGGSPVIGVDGADADINLTVTPKGVGKTLFNGRVDVVGSVRVGLDLASCTASLIGAIHRNGSYLEYCNGTSWTLLSVGNGINQLTGDVLAVGPGSVSSTVATIGGVTAANVASGANLANAGTNANTPSTLVKRDASGNFSAGTISANITGNVSGSAASFTGSLSGDVTGTQSATSVVKVNGGSIPGSAVLVATNSSNQFIGITTLPTSAMPAFNGDVTSIGSSLTLTLANSGVTAGTYSKVTVDAKGRVLNGANIGSSDVIAALGYTPVNKAGDTMTGILSLPTNGLVVGTSQFLVSGGKVGIGTSAPGAKLDVAGAMVSQPAAPASSTVDLSLSNTHVIASPGGSVITLQNMVAGGQYTLIIQDTTSRQYTFGGCDSTYFKPANQATTAGTQSIYGLITVKSGSSWLCYVTWATGFQ